MLKIKNSQDPYDLSNRSFTNFKVTAPNDVLEISETNIIRVSRNSVVLTRVAQICCFGNFRNIISLKKLKR